MIKKIILITIITLGVIACDGNSGKELIETATNDNFEEDKLLVEQETDVNANDKDGVTDLMHGFAFVGETIVMEATFTAQIVKNK